MVTGLYGRFMTRRVALVSALVIALARGAAWGQDAAQPVNKESRSALRPDRSIADQLMWMRGNWPDQMAVGVVEAVGEAQGFSKGDTIYLTQECRAVGWIWLRWLYDSAPPGDRFHVHYWINVEEQGQTPRVGSRHVAFLEPAMAQGVFVSEMLLPATSEQIAAVQRAIMDVGR